MMLSNITVITYLISLFSLDSLVLIPAEFSHHLGNFNKRLLIAWEEKQGVSQANCKGTLGYRYLLKCETSIFLLNRQLIIDNL